MASVAKITGTMLRPGTSLNRRHYTAGAIASMVKRAQARIDSGGPPLTMRVSHPSDEPTAPVTEIVGRLTKVYQADDGSAKFEAHLADTTAGRDVAALVGGKRPYLSGVSIRGSWVGDPHKVQTPDGPAESADDMELDGLDFTHKPGVPGAGVETFAAGTAVGEASRGRHAIAESVMEVSVSTIRETTPDEPYDSVDHSAAQKVLAGRPLHEYTQEELRLYLGATLGQFYVGAPGSRSRNRT
jgi:hypothetical protein